MYILLNMMPLLAFISSRWHFLGVTSEPKGSQETVYKVKSDTTDEMNYLTPVEVYNGVWGLVWPADMHRLEHIDKTVEVLEENVKCPTKLKIIVISRVTLRMVK